MRRTSQTPLSGSPTPRLKWRCPIGSALLGSSPALGADGTIYFGAEDGKVYAVTPNGTIKWRYTLSTGTYRYVRSTPSVGADGTIYIGQWDTSHVYALLDRADHAELKWQSPDVGAVAFSSPALGSDDTVYILGCGLTRGLSALHGADGALKWRFTTGDSPSAWNQGSAALGADGTIYFASEDAHIYAIQDAGDHYVVRWSYLVNLPYQQGTSSPAVGADGTVYVGWVGWGQSNFFALNANGTLKWSLAFPDRVMSSPAIAADGTIVVGCDDGKVYALADLGTAGQVVWSFQTGSYVESSAAIDAQGRVYIGSYDNKLYCLDLATGAPLWSYATAYHILTSPAIGAQRTVYVSGWDGYLYAFAPFPFGDLNCDDRVDFADIDPFVLALSDPAGYQQQFPNCNILNGDCNGDGYVDFADIDPFVAILSGG